MIHISVSATGVWLAECPLVVGAGLVPFSGGDSPLAAGLSVGSWGRGATDTRVLAWFSSSTWKDSAYEKCTDNTDINAHTPTSFILLFWHANKGELFKNKQMHSLFMRFMCFSCVYTQKGVLFCNCFTDGCLTIYMHACFALLVAKNINPMQLTCLLKFVAVLLLSEISLKIIFEPCDRNLFNK